jgi:hypothetical protein
MRSKIYFGKRNCQDTEKEEPETNIACSEMESQKKQRGKKTPEC